jgi:uncharacterized protein
MDTASLHATSINPVEPLRPMEDPSTAFFWEGCRQGKLLIQRCHGCGYFQHWPRPVCKKCLSWELSPGEVSGRGTLYTYTTCVQAFHPWFEARLPYVLAVIELADQPGLKMVSNIVDCVPVDVHTGMELEVFFEHVDDRLTLPMFRPLGVAVLEDTITMGSV